MKLKLSTFKIQYFLLIFSLFVSKTVVSQEQIIYNQSEKQSFLLRYHTQGDKELNSLLTSIAQANQTSLSALELNFSFTLEKRITKRGKNLFLDAMLKNLHLKQEVKYKDFVINRFLYPKKINSKLIWKKAGAKSPLKTFDLKNNTITSTNTKLASISFLDTVKAKKYELQIKNLALKYTQENVREFNRYKTAVDKYYDYNNSLNQQVAETRNIPLEEMRNDPKPRIFEQLQGYKRIIRSNKILFQNIDKDNFKEVLQHNDPLKLSERTERLIALNSQCEKTISDFERNADKIFYDQGLVHLRNRRNEAAIHAFKKSIQVNEDYSPAKFQLARIAYNKNNLSSAINLLYDIQNDKGRYPVVRNDAQVLAEQIYENLLNEASRYSDIGKFGMAEDKLYMAEEFCNKLNLLECTSSLEFQKRRVAVGRYEKSLALAESAMMSSMLLSSENYLKEAENQFNRDKFYIDNDSRLRQLRVRLYYEYLGQGNQLVAEGNFDGALIEYNNAYRICNSYNYVSCSEELNKGVRSAQTGIYKNLIQDAGKAYDFNDLPTAERTVLKAIDYQKQYNLTPDSNADRLLSNIKQRQYQSLINMGMANIENEKMEQALENFKSAKKLEQEFNLSPDSELSTMMSQTAVNIVMIKSGDAEQYLEQNNLNQARKILQEMKKIREEINLQDNPAINMFIDNLHESIFNQQCKNVENSYNTSIKDAENQIKNRKYATAESELKKATDLLAANAMCGISDSEAQRILSEIRTPALYQNLIIVIENNYQQGNYSIIMKSFEEASAFFEDENVQKYGLKHKSVSEFLQNANEPMLLESVLFYSKDLEFELAMNSLKIMKQKNYKRKNTKAAQQVMGSALADYDHKRNSRANYKTLLAQRTNNDKWFKYLEKEYTKRWKSFK